MAVISKIRIRREFTRDFSRFNDSLNVHTNTQPKVHAVRFSAQIQICLPVPPDYCPTQLLGKPVSENAYVTRFNALS